MSLLELGMGAVERGLVPDPLVRAAIRRLCRTRLRGERRAGGDAGEEPTPAHREFLASLSKGPIAPVPDKANEQHYELPPEFFGAILGPRRKYSCCYFASDRSTLAEAEDDALAITSQRADLADGQQILELGCGWGSLSLWLAERFPGSRITAVSNSRRQRQFIESVARSRGLNNLTVVTADMNLFDPGAEKFDRVVSVEMFEHMRNYRLLLARIAGWLQPEGKVFVHLFCHRRFAYPFESEGAANWMGRHFFTGGIMPSVDLLSQFNDFLQVEEQHRWSGRHYQRTAELWLHNLDSRRGEVLRILQSAYGVVAAPRWLNRWRVFFMATGELFGFADGEEWFVAHYLLARTNRPRPAFLARS